MLTLINYPVNYNSGKVDSILPGFSSQIVEFKRVDTNIFSIGAGLNNKISVTISNEYLTSELNINEFVYIYSTTTNYKYDGVFKVLDIILFGNDTVILLDTEFLEIPTNNGYINYKQNYYVEYKLVDVSNNNIMVYPNLLSNDGLSNGVIKLNVSNIVDYLKSDILEISGGLISASSRFKIMYREVYRENETNIFTLLDELPIIVLYCADKINVETISNNFNEPKIWAEYPFFINFIHSTENNSGTQIDVMFSELDINKNILTTDNFINVFDNDLFGILQINFNDKTKVIENETEYISFVLNDSILPDYDPDDYDENDYKTT
jgi:hypothetical protein